MEGKNLKNVSWNAVLKAAVDREESSWKELLVASDEVARERCMKI